MHNVFSDAAKQALTTWIAHEYWYKNNETEEHNFYRFVRALWECNCKLIDEEELRETILQEVLKLHSDWDRESAQKVIADHRYANRTQEIMDYHRANDR